MRNRKWLTSLGVASVLAAAVATYGADVSAQSFGRFGYGSGYNGAPTQDQWSNGSLRGYGPGYARMHGWRGGGPCAAYGYGYGHWSGWRGGHGPGMMYGYGPGSANGNDNGR